jgi:hypothetical protein
MNTFVEAIFTIIDKKSATATAMALLHDEWIQY